RAAYRWLVFWSLLVVASTILGIGYTASRYQLLFVVPASLLWAGFLTWLARKIHAIIPRLALYGQAEGEIRQRLIPLLAWLPVVALLVIYGGLGIPYIGAQITSWQRASDIEGAAIHQIAVLGVGHPDAQTLYLVNVPDNLPAPADPTGHFEHGAYLFQDGAA